MHHAFPGVRRVLELLVLSLVAFFALPAAAQTDPPTRATIAKQRAVQTSLPFADRRDFALADRGFVTTRREPLIKTPDGRVAWDLNAFAFAKGAAPDSVNPSLWRQSTLLSKHGLFKVTDRVWQVRGFDLANITFVKGDAGWIVIDTLTCEETARAAYDLVTEQLGKRPIAAIILTHSHGDHFGGTSALLRDAVPNVPILAPKGFLEAAVSENVIAGPAMIRRASYHLGGPLPRSTTGSVSSGIGPGIAAGTQTLVPPTREIERTGEALTIDGVRMIFHLTPGTEAPAEMNIGFPDLKVIDLAENANATQHNILTTRGAQIRNAKRWAEGLTEAIDVFPDAEVVIASHAWPRWGKAQVGEYLAKHRDLYAYLHDQTVRLMNKGLTGDEIAATLQLPPALAAEWYDRPYYGSLSFNTRAVYQYYMGFFDGNPVHLAPLPPEEGGRRYVAALGGAAKVRALAQAAYDSGDYSWAAELLNRAVFADTGDTAAKALLARCYDQLGWQTETSTWRNFYLTGATELREGVKPRPGGEGGALAMMLPTRDVFDLLATRLDPAKVGDARVAIAFVFPDRNERVGVEIANGVLVHRATPPAKPDATLTVPRAIFLRSLLTGAPLPVGEARIEGDAQVLAQFARWFERPDPAFAIVTP